MHSKLQVGMSSYQTTKKECVGHFIQGSISKGYSFPGWNKKILSRFPGCIIRTATAAAAIATAIG